MLDCCRPLSDVAQVGLTLSEFACLSRCNSLDATVHSPVLDAAGGPAEREQGLAQFRNDLRATSTGKGVMALSYSRAALGQTGDGHFSPIGGWCEEDDMVLILDVARFKVRRSRAPPLVGVPPRALGLTRAHVCAQYPSYWVPTSLAYDSMLPLDKATGQPRGYVVLDVAGADSGSLGAPLSQTTVTLNKVRRALSCPSCARASGEADGRSFVPRSRPGRRSTARSRASSCARPRTRRARPTSSTRSCRTSPPRSRRRPSPGARPPRPRSPRSSTPSRRPASPSRPRSPPPQIPRPSSSTSSSSSRSSRPDPPSPRSSRPRPRRT